MRYKVSFDLSELIDAGQDIITKAMLPTVHRAVKAIAYETVYHWKDAVSKSKLWNGEKQAYMESVKWRMLSDFSAIVETDYKLASEIETGRPQRDLKKMLDTSLKVRNGKKGRYLIIPFRHSTPGQVALGQDMPPDIYKKARFLDASKVTGNFSRPSGTGAFNMKTRKAITVPAKSYKWGDRLPAGMSAKLKDYHTTDIHAGMVRFNTSAGGANSSAYLTFRIMGEWQTNKWIVQAKPGQFIAKKVADKISIDAPRILSETFSRIK